MCSDKLVNPASFHLVSADVDRGVASDDPELFVPVFNAAVTAFSQTPFNAEPLAVHTPQTHERITGVKKKSLSHFNMGLTEG